MNEKKTNDEIVKQLIKILSENEVKRQNDFTYILSNLLFSVGSCLEQCNVKGSEEILMRYATNPTLGNALMAQALKMKETWTEFERENNHGTK